MNVVQLEQQICQVALALDGVTRSFPTDRGELLALGPIDLEIEQGETVAVVGPSGCGKTTLLELAAGLLSPSDGRVDTQPAVSMAQRDQLLPWLDGLDNAALPYRIAGVSRRKARAMARPRFSEFGLAGCEALLPSQLSGGMRQRVAFLRTINADRPLLALDEPFAALDAITRGQMQEWLAELLRDAERTTLLATHDIEEALLIADRLLGLSRRPGRVVFDQRVTLDEPRNRLDPALIAQREIVMESLQ